jgi:hypothetical protein
MTEEELISRVRNLIRALHRTRTIEPEYPNEPRRIIHQGDYEAAVAIIATLRSPAYGDGPFEEDQL